MSTMLNRVETLVNRVKATPALVLGAYRIAVHSILIPKVADAVELYAALLVLQIRRLNGSAQHIKFFLRMGELTIADIEAWQGQDPTQMAQHFVALRNLSPEAARRFDLFLWGILTNFHSATVLGMIQDAISRKNATETPNE